MVGTWVWSLGGSAEEWRSPVKDLKAIEEVILGVRVETFDGGVKCEAKALGKKINNSFCFEHEAGAFMDINSGHTRVAIDGCQCKIVQFIFGDSLSDVGNNKYLARSLAQASLPWYGIDFGNGLPNGRFTNGRTVADIIGDNTGLPRPPAFLGPSLTEDVILENGVNYASGGGGILNETGGYFDSKTQTHHVARLEEYDQLSRAFQHQHCARIEANGPSPAPAVAPSPQG
ncbi:hypothetical protein GH714_021455 [Hevea brasiliensis]|uniref:Uncharacterized protein n=1 Tax=Hevea brasiliensis TaxID=3981 RepID=A0A6A6MEE7_HEVBR|nr:hypothetical protein GH714_021455 [Hevea brasiliensis]